MREQSREQTRTEQRRWENEQNNGGGRTNRTAVVGEQKAGGRTMVVGEIAREKGGRSLE
jgi:hypothetical protein